MAKQEKDSAALEEKGKEFKGPFYSDVTFPESHSSEKPENEQSTQQVESHSDDGCGNGY